MNTPDLEQQAIDLHEYLVKTIGHNWRFPTWKTKYLARLRTYGFEKCIIAIDGFRSQKWWMAEKSQDAPDCIFRSDKSFEKFLAAGMALPEHNQLSEDYEREKTERESKFAEIRSNLEKKNAGMTLRMHRKLQPLKDELNETSWNAFIAPLLFVAYQDGMVIMFHQHALWVQEHYADRIAEVLEAPIIIVDKIS